MSFIHTRGKARFGQIEFTEGAVIRTKKLEITSTPDGSEQDTGWDLPQSAIVFDVFVEVTTAEATGGTKTLDVGLITSETGQDAGDPDGFLEGLVVSSTGIKQGTITATTGTHTTYVSARTLGDLLIDGSDGGDAADTNGLVLRVPHVVTGSGAVSVVYTAGSADFAEFRGNIHIVYADLT